jgi:signal transduction histidine kinase
MNKIIKKVSKNLNFFQFYLLVLFIYCISPILYLYKDIGVDSSIIITYILLFSIALIFLSRKIIFFNDGGRIRQHLSIIAHDIKVPLSRIIFKMQVANNYIVEHYKDIVEIECMINDITLAIDNDRISTYEKKKNIDFYSMLEFIVEDYLDMGKNINLEADNITSRNIFACPIFMKRAIINLIENSFKFASKVDLKIVSENGIISLDIIDNGPGIEPKDFSKIKLAFYQGKNSKMGKGLGLYITTKIIEEHHGTLSLSNNDNGGFRANIHLPTVLSQTDNCVIL